MLSDDSRYSTDRGFLKDQFISHSGQECKSSSSSTLFEKQKDIIFLRTKISVLSSGSKILKKKRDLPGFSR